MLRGCPSVFMASALRRMDRPGSGRLLDRPFKKFEATLQEKLVPVRCLRDSRRSSSLVQLACECACYGAKHFSFTGCQTTTNALSTCQFWDQRRGLSFLFCDPSSA